MPLHRGRPAGSEAMGEYKLVSGFLRLFGKKYLDLESRFSETKFFGAHRLVFDNILVRCLRGCLFQDLIAAAQRIHTTKVGGCEKDGRESHLPVQKGQKMCNHKRVST